jgi:hypothetical protein
MPDSKTQGRTSEYIGSTIGSPLTLIRNNNDNKHAYADQLNSFTHIRALLVLHDHSIT